MVCVANELAQMLYKFFSRHTKQPAFKSNNMKKEITIEEWFRLASEVLNQVSLAVSNDGKITFDEAVQLLIFTITEFMNAYNK